MDKDKKPKSGDVVSLIVGLLLFVAVMSMAIYTEKYLWLDLDSQSRHLTRYHERRIKRR